MRIVRFLLCLVLLSGCNRVNGSFSSRESKEVSEVMVINVCINGNEFVMDLFDNESSRDFVRYLEERGGECNVSMDDYGGFEKCCDLGRSLVRSDRYHDIVPGDVILYLGKTLTIYYDYSSYSLTKLGHIRDFRDVFVFNGNEVRFYL